VRYWTDWKSVLQNAPVSVAGASEDCHPTQGFAA
jgi:hypothetical protein